MEYDFNIEAASIADGLIEKYHPRLSGLKLAYLFKSKPESENPRPPKMPRDGKKQVWAKASKITDKWLPLLEKDYRFVIEFDKQVWDLLSLEQQEALVDHELCHCGNDADGCYMRSHDLEEFREIVARHGYWKDDVRLFAESLPLFDRTEEEPPAHKKRNRRQPELPA